MPPVAAAKATNAPSKTEAARFAHRSFTSEAGSQKVRLESPFSAESSGFELAVRLINFPRHMAMCGMLKHGDPNRGHAGCNCVAIRNSKYDDPDSSKCRSGRWPQDSVDCGRRCDARSVGGGGAGLSS